MLISTKKTSINSYFDFWLFFKDAGFVYESFRNETNRIFEIFGLTNRIHKTGIWKLRHETNPWNESFENWLDSRIRKYRIRMDS
jgi:hypothetical protein